MILMFFSGVRNITDWELPEDSEPLRAGIPFNWHHSNWGSVRNETSCKSNLLQCYFFQKLITCFCPLSAPSKGEAGKVYNTLLQASSRNTKNEIKTSFGYHSLDTLYEHPLLLHTCQSTLPLPQSIKTVGTCCFQNLIF